MAYTFRKGPQFAILSEDRAAIEGMIEVILREGTDVGQIAKVATQFKFSQPSVRRWIVGAIGDIYKFGHLSPTSINDIRMPDDVMPTLPAPEPSYFIECTDAEGNLGEFTLPSADDISGPPMN